MSIFNKPIVDLNQDELKELAKFIDNCPVYVYHKNDDNSVDLVHINKVKS